MPTYELPKARLPQGHLPVNMVVIKNRKPARVLLTEVLAMLKKVYQNANL